MKNSTIIAVINTPLVTNPGFNSKPAINITGTADSMLIIFIVVPHSNINIHVTGYFLLIRKHTVRTA